MNSVSFILKKHTAAIVHITISAFLLFFFTNYLFNLHLEPELVIVVVSLALIALSVFVLRFKQSLLYGLAFLIPLSVPVLVYGGSTISMPAELICVFLSGFFFIKLIIGRKLDAGFLRHPITLLILADLAWLFISSGLSQMPEVSFKRFIIRLCYYITFYYFYYELFNLDLRHIKKIFTVHIIGFLIPIVHTLISHASIGFSPVGADAMPAPFYFDHTIYGASLVFFIPFLISSVTDAASRKEKLFYSVLLLILLAATVLSYSRAAWLSLLIALAFYLILKYHTKIKYLIYLLCLFVVAGMLNLNKITNAFKNNKEESHSHDITMHFKSISNVNTDVSNKERINRWKCALRMFADKPLHGFGPGTYQFFYGQYQRREDMTRISTYNGTKGHAHSEYLNYLSETGLPGLLIFLSLITTVSIKCLRYLKKGADPETARIALYVFIGLITYLIHALFNGFLEFDKIAMPVFVSFAAITSLDLKRKSQQHV